MNTDLSEIKTLLLDIGGVLLTNGWDRQSRALAASKFNLDSKEMQMRHELAFVIYELGKITLEEYLNLVVFYQKRTFSIEDFKAFMLEQSAALDGMLAYFMEVKSRHHLKVIAISNEGRELSEYRIKQFKLNDLFDAYVVSGYVHLRKPDKNIWQLACGISNTQPKEALYIDNTPMLVEVGRSFGCQSFHFQDLETTKDFIKTCIFHKRSIKKI